MADLNIRFPPKVSLNAVGGPGFMTSGGSIPIMASGAESRTQDWELERGIWVVSHETRVRADWEPLLSFFRQVAGMANTFRFKDWVDFECASGSGFFVTANSGSPIGKQMVKRYSFPTLSGGTLTYDRFITKPVSGTITITGGGTLDYATGIVDGGAPTAWHGEFDCWCRLNSDVMRNQVVNRGRDGLLVGWRDIEIVEVTNEVTA